MEVGMKSQRLESGIARFIKPAMVAVLIIAVLSTGCYGKDLKTATPESVGISSERLARMDAFMQDQIDSKKTGGIVVLVARNGKVVHHKAFGYADIESGKKLTIDHLFRLYSMTKPVTSVALLTLYEQGKFQLTDPLELYIPAFKDVKVFAGVDDDGKMILEEPVRKITIQDVFRHTAGFSYGFGSDLVAKGYQEAGINFSELDSLKELIDKLAKQPLLYQPGEKWVYSVSHDVQAYLVEFFSGMPFDKYVTETIIKPLGMKDAVFGIPDEYISRYTTNYGPAKDGKGIVPIDKPETSNYARFKDHPFGGLSLSSTTTDYFKFSQMLLNGGEFNGVRILGEKTVELMRANHLPDAIPGISMGGGVGYGLGVSSTINPAASGNLSSVGNFGWGGAASTQVVIDPVENLVLLFFSQFMPSDMATIGKFQTLAYQALVE
jgi:CubicO group peptidase (beta-lactamase class C family)